MRHGLAQGAADVQLALFGAALAATVAAGQALGHAPDQGLHGGHLARVDGGQLLLGEQLLAQLAAAFAGIEVVLALDIAAGLLEQGGALPGQAVGQGGVAGLARLVDQALQPLQAHLVEDAAGEQAALAGQADIAGAGALAGRFHGLGQARQVVVEQHLGQGLVIAQLGGRRAGVLGVGQAAELLAVEEGVETALETDHLVGGLGQGGAQGVAEQLAVGVAGDVGGPVGVDGLGRRDAHVDRAQGPQEFLHGALHQGPARPPPPCGEGPGGGGDRIALAVMAPGCRNCGGSTRKAEPTPPPQPLPARGRGF